jgi:hypothetical protein
MENRPRESVSHITNTSDALKVDTHVDSPFYVVTVTTKHLASYYRTDLLCLAGMFDKLYQPHRSTQHIDFSLPEGGLSPCTFLSFVVLARL